MYFRCQCNVSLITIQRRFSLTHRLHICVYLDGIERHFDGINRHPEGIKHYSISPRFHVGLNLYVRQI